MLMKIYGANQWGRRGEITGCYLAEFAKSYISAINDKDSLPSLKGGWKAVNSTKRQRRWLDHTKKRWELSSDPCLLYLLSLSCFVIPRCNFKLVLCICMKCFSLKIFLCHPRSVGLPLSVSGIECPIYLVERQGLD